MKVCVSQKDINWSNRNLINLECPLALALVREGYHSVSIGTNRAMGSMGSQQFWFKLAPDAAAFVKAFDAYEKLEPTELTLDIITEGQHERLGFE